MRHEAWTEAEGDDAPAWMAYVLLIVMLVGMLTLTN